MHIQNKYLIYFCRVSLSGNPAKKNKIEFKLPDLKKNSNPDNYTLPDLDEAVISTLSSLNTFSIKSNFSYGKYSSNNRKT